MKHINKYFKLFLLISVIASSSSLKAQVNGFTISDPSFPAAHNLGATFPINISFNWTPSTTSATVVINFNAALVMMQAAQQACQDVWWLLVVDRRLRLPSVTLRPVLTPEL